MEQHYKTICELYRREMELLEKSNEDINNDEAYLQLMECHDKRLHLQGSEKLSHIFETVYGPNHPTTIDVYMEEAVLFEQDENYDKEELIKLYSRILESARKCHGESGEKTIESKLQIITLIRMMRNEEEEIPAEYGTEYTIELLESLFHNRHEHPLYGTYIASLLAEEYIYSGRKYHALEVFRSWANFHPLESITDIEVCTAWLEYGNLLGELGYLKEAMNCADHFCNILNQKEESLLSEEFIRSGNEKESDPKEDIFTSIPYLYRRTAEIFVSCSRYDKGIQLLEQILMEKNSFPDDCAMEFYNIRGNLGHLYDLNGSYTKARDYLNDLLNELDQKNIQHPSRLIFENFVGITEEKLIDYEESFQRIQRVYKESKEKKGENNPDTILYEYNLANAFLSKYREGDYETEEYLNQAQILMEDALERTMQPPITDLLFALSIRRGLAELLMNKGEFEEAILQMKNVYERTRELLSDDNLETADVAGRYATMTLEVQQAYMDIPEWIDVIDPEPLLQYCYTMKKEYLGDRHGETIEDLYMYIRAAQSNEMIRYLQHDPKADLSRLWELHDILLKNIRFDIEQAVSIDSIEKQSNFLGILDREADLFLWLLGFVEGRNSDHAISEWYDQIIPYKNILFDLMFQKKFQVQKINLSSEQISMCMKERKGIFIDIWQDVNAWYVFYIDENGIQWDVIDPISKEDIPSIEDETSEPQQQIDYAEYTITEKIEKAQYLAERIGDYIKDHMNLPERVYLNLHKQITGCPVASFLQKILTCQIYTISSATELLTKQRKKITVKSDETVEKGSVSNKNPIICQIGYMGTEKSMDQLVIGQNIKTIPVKNLKEVHTALLISGHGFFHDDCSIPYNRRNYILTESGDKLFNEEILKVDLQQLNLVLLPICQSGTGTIFSNFGPFSTGVVFRLAGADATIETLWDVRTSVSLVFEYEFFKQINQGYDLQNSFWKTIQTLRDYTGKQLKVLCSLLGDDSAYRDTRRMLYMESCKEKPFADPSYWAGFVLMGEN